MKEYRSDGRSTGSLDPALYLEPSISDYDGQTPPDPTIAVGSSFGPINHLRSYDVHGGPYLQAQASPMSNEAPRASHSDTEQWLGVPTFHQSGWHRSHNNEQYDVDQLYPESSYPTSVSGGMDIPSAISSTTGPFEDEVMDNMEADDMRSASRVTNADEQMPQEEFIDLFYGHDPIKYSSYERNCSRAYANYYSFIRNSLKKHWSRGNVARERISDQDYKLALEVRCSTTGRSMSLRDRHIEHYKLVRRVLFGTSTDIPIQECSNKGKHDVCRAKRTEKEKKGKGKSKGKGKAPAANQYESDSAPNLDLNSTMSMDSQSHGVTPQKNIAYPSPFLTYTAASFPAPWIEDHVGDIQAVDSCVESLAVIKNQLTCRSGILSNTLRKGILNFTAFVNESRDSVRSSNKAFLTPSSIPQQPRGGQDNLPHYQETMVANESRYSRPGVRPGSSHLPLTPDGSSGSNQHRRHSHDRQYFGH